MELEANTHEHTTENGAVTFQLDYTVTSDEQTRGNRTEIDTTRVKIDACDVEQLRGILTELSSQYSEIRVGLRLKR